MWWKALGLAGMAGLVATGALTVRGERRRAAYTPEQIRERLHARHAQAEATYAHREVVLDSDIPRPRTWRERTDLRLRRYTAQLSTALRHRLPWAAATDIERGVGEPKHRG